MSDFQVDDPAWRCNTCDWILLHKAGYVNHRNSHQRCDQDTSTEMRWYRLSHLQKSVQIFFTCLKGHMALHTHTHTKKKKKKILLELNQVTSKIITLFVISATKFVSRWPKWKVIIENTVEEKESVGGGSPRCIVAKVMDCDLRVTEFERQSNFYVQFHGEVWTPLSP